MTHTLNCEAFDERLADYLEGDLAAADHRAMQAHLASCARCAALVRDLEQIRADAGMLPVLAPTADLWDGIAARIEAPVIPFAAPASAAGHGVLRAGILGRFRLAAAAAALVVVTAGVTYLLTVSGMGSPGRGPQSVTSVRPVTGTDTAAPGDDVRRTVVAPSPNEEIAASATTPRPESQSTSERGTPATRNVGSVPASVTYSREIDRLRSIYAQNRYQLDPRTAAIIEANLKVIDEAIAQSKAALAQDPASRFLSNQLNSALDKKLELLRTAALLPNRT
jgi:anti-sigma factor RsiW